MAARIEAVATTRPQGRRKVRSLELATRAAEQALARAGCARNDVGVIVYTGLYRDDNVCEPAIAPFIQDELGINPVCEGERAPTTFSFDLANGTCGFVNALQVVDGFIGSGRVRYGLVVTSDIDTTPGVSEGCSFEPGGAAILLGASDGSEGFSAFGAQSFGKHSQLLEGSVRWRGEGRSALARRLRTNHALTIHEGPEYVERCAECAAEAIDRFLAGRDLAIEDVDLFALSSTPAGFPEALALELSLAPEALAAADEPGSHTSGPALALAGAIASPSWATASRVLLVAAGAGISVALALYTRSRDV